MENTNKKVDTTKRAQIIALSIVAVFIILAVIMWKNANLVYNYDTTLALSAKAVNLTCPQMVDDDTRLDSVTTEPGRNYLYHYTAINLDREALNVKNACDVMKETILENMKGNIGMAEFGQQNVIIHFNFNDKNGLELCRIRVMAYEWYRKAKRPEKDTLENSNPQEIR
jgi:hypothetical protein